MIVKTWFALNAASKGNKLYLINKRINKKIAHLSIIIYPNNSKAHLRTKEINTPQTSYYLKHISISHNTFWEWFSILNSIIYILF